MHVLEVQMKHMSVRMKVSQASGDVQRYLLAPAPSLQPQHLCASAVCLAPDNGDDEHRSWTAHITTYTMVSSCTDRLLHLPLGQLCWTRTTSK